MLCSHPRMPLHQKGEARYVNVHNDWRCPLCTATQRCAKASDVVQPPKDAPATLPCNRQLHHNLCKNLAGRGWGQSIQAHNMPLHQEAEASFVQGRHACGGIVQPSKDVDALSKGALSKGGLFTCCQAQEAAVSCELLRQGSCV